MKGRNILEKGERKIEKYEIEIRNNGIFFFFFLKKQKNVYIKMRNNVKGEDDSVNTGK